MEQHIAVVGVGPAGLSLAALLADSGVRITLIDRQPRENLESPAYDGRDIALTHRSRHTLEKIAVWQALSDNSISPIHHARVQDGESPYSLDFDHAPTGKSELGYLVSNHRLREELFKHVVQLDNCELLADTSLLELSRDAHQRKLRLSNGTELNVDLAIAADNRFSSTRRAAGIAASTLDFGRTAIVCRMQHERSNKATACEFFQYAQTLAVLPVSAHESSLVVTLANDRATKLLAQNRERYADTLQKLLNGELGQMQLHGERYDYPLVAVLAQRFYSHRLALLGDAAVGMHPVTAHGYNLGLRGAETLAELIADAARCGSDIGADTLLARYQQRHRAACLPLYHGTNALVKLFTDARPGARLARKLVLRCGERASPIKRAILNQLTESGGRNALPGILAGF